VNDKTEAAKNDETGIAKPKWGSVVWLAGAALGLLAIKSAINKMRKSEPYPFLNPIDEVKASLAQTVDELDRMDREARLQRGQPLDETDQAIQAMRRANILDDAAGFKQALESVEKSIPEIRRKYS